MSNEEVEQIKVDELKAALKQRGLRIYGKKKELVARLKEALELQRKHGYREGDEGTEANDGDDDGSSDDDDDSEANNDEEDRNDTDKSEQYKTPRPPQRRQQAVNSTIFTFRGMEDSLEKFSGAGLLSIQEWVEEFEQYRRLKKKKIET